MPSPLHFCASDFFLLPDCVNHTVSTTAVVLVSNFPFFLTSVGNASQPDTCFEAGMRRHVFMQLLGLIHNPNYNIDESKIYTIISGIFLGGLSICYMNLL